MTDLKVVEFKSKPAVPVPFKPNENIIECLEAMLTQAKEGKIIGLVCSALDDHNMATYSKVGTLSFGNLGALQILSTKLANSFIARAE